MPTFLDTPIVIAGAGPVGVTCAMELARLGVDSIVIEARRSLPPNPRCNTTNARSMELLRRLGCADAVRAAGLPLEHNTDVVYMTTFNGPEITRYERSTTRDVLNGNQHGVAANWPTPEPQHFLSQLYLEPVLRSHAQKHWGVGLREGVRLVGFEHDGQGVTSTAVDLDSGEEFVIRSQYLVGADGSTSAVRNGIGARLEGVARLGDNVSTFFRSQRLRELSNATPGWMYRFIDGGAVLVAIDGNDTFLIHNRVPPGAHRDTWDSSQAMEQAVGEPFDCDVISVARWTPRAMVANKFREGRVFLAGDAAHLWVPMGGFGMNAGIADAISLSWRFAGVLQHWLDPKILDTYETERAPIGSTVARQAAKWSIDLAILTQKTPDQLAELRNDPETRSAFGQEVRDLNLGEFECPGFQLGFFYNDSPIIVHDTTNPAPENSLENYHETSWPGVRLPHVTMTDGSAPFDHLGTGFTLLRIGAHAPSGAALITAAATRKIPFVVLATSLPEAVSKYEDYGLVLVRPDQHVVWRSRNDADAPVAELVLDRITGVLVPERNIAELNPSLLDTAHSFAANTHIETPDRTLVYQSVIDDNVIVRSRIEPDGTLSTPHRYLTGRFPSIAPDPAGGVWVIDQADLHTVTRYDSAGRQSAVVHLDGTAEACRIEKHNDRLQLVICGETSVGSECCWLVELDAPTP